MQSDAAALVTSRLKYRLLELSLSMRAAAFQSLARKAGFRPDQPRIPAGNPDGGQWTGAGGSGATQVSHEETPPDVPKNPPPTVRDRNQVSLAVARYLHAARMTMAGLRLSQWIYEHARNRITAYLEPAKSLGELLDAARRPRPGYDLHHIVEQTPARRDGFSDSRINAEDNLVGIPTYRHWEITAWYARSNQAFGGISPREFLRGKDWSTRRSVGLYAMKIHGVLNP